ncbi:MAG: DUF6273 domain-containing protein, partial [Lachnospiraceae bacterium]|nr:DUF6273 domain-containing protein [Lachnospiraceae bacterium]
MPAHVYPWNLALGPGVLSFDVNTETAYQVLFGGTKWIVAGFDEEGVASVSGNATLLTKGNIAYSPFSEDISTNVYSDSDLKKQIDSFAQSVSLTEQEKEAITPRTLVSGNYIGEDTDCVAGSEVKDALLWPLSTKEAYALDKSLLLPSEEDSVESSGGDSSSWWLRSPGDLKEAYAQAADVCDYYVEEGGYDVYESEGVRPAFHLNLEDVLFLASPRLKSNSEGHISERSMEEDVDTWKLTLLDNTRNFSVSQKEVEVEIGDSIKLDYTGAKAGENEYISAILSLPMGTLGEEPAGYGRLKQAEAEKGTLVFELPDDLYPREYVLKLFNEHYEEGSQADAASDFVEVNLFVIGYYVDAWGEHMSVKSGRSYQSVAPGNAINPITFEAEEGYYFPEDYSVDAKNGISVTRNSDETITVSGTPTANTNIELPAPSAWPIANIGETEYTDLQTAIEGAQNGAVITLLRNAKISKKLTVENEKSITLDLNGFTIDRGLADYDPKSEGCVISVDDNSTLTITDSSSEKTGVITGGNNSGYGGGVCISSGTLKLKGGTIKGNSAQGRGGGVYIGTGSLEMTGGVITGNIAVPQKESFSFFSELAYGGGVYACSGTYLKVSGSSKITDNHILRDEETCDNNVYFFSDDDCVQIIGKLTEGAS